MTQDERCLGESYIPPTRKVAEKLIVRTVEEAKSIMSGRQKPYDSMDLQSRLSGPSDYPFKSGTINFGAYKTILNLRILSWINFSFSRFYKINLYAFFLSSLYPLIL